jgi:hypothetical protein
VDLSPQPCTLLNFLRHAMDNPKGNYCVVARPILPLWQKFKERVPMGWVLRPGHVGADTGGGGWFRFVGYDNILVGVDLAAVLIQDDCPPHLRAHAVRYVRP